MSTIDRADLRGKVVELAFEFPDDIGMAGALFSRNEVLALIDAAPAADSDGLAAALQAIVDYEPDYGTEEIPDHSDCPKCKAREGHPISQGRCDDLYRALMGRDDRRRHVSASQHWKMRGIARDALAARLREVGQHEPR